ncbi:MAG: hypothetical protein IKU60_00090 [Clostridia bacterium]|nr:hypothetical protein [Clostridia bacterium]
MKKYLIIISMVLALLTGCGAPYSSDEGCLYCGEKDAYIYQIEEQKLSLCTDCYNAKLTEAEQAKDNLIK